MPAGLDVTVPAPPPAFPTSRVNGTRANVAVAVWFAVMVSVHGPSPEHAPDQPSNVEPVPEDAVSVTEVPWSNWYEQLEPHAIPAGLDVTVPVPVPAFCSVNVFE